MAIPISYNIRSVGARWANAVVSVLGIAGTVGVFLAMLAMAAGVLLSGRSLKGSCGGVGTGCPCSDEERQACAAKSGRG